MAQIMRILKLYTYHALASLFGPPCRCLTNAGKRVYVDKVHIYFLTFTPLGDLYASSLLKVGTEAGESVGYLDQFGLCIKS